MPWKFLGLCFRSPIGMSTPANLRLGYFVAIVSIALSWRKPTPMITSYFFRMSDVKFGM
jgi:hypothetical protein